MFCGIAQPVAAAHPVERVLAGERRADAGDGVGGQEALQHARFGQHLLHLLGAGELVGRAGAEDGPRTLQQQTGVPVLPSGECYF